MKRVSISLLLVFCCGNAQLTRSQVETVHVLFVGNSYTYADDIPWITTQLAASRKQPKTLEVEMIAFPGASLQSHWEKDDVTRRLEQSKWDYVVLQEQSSRPI